VLDEFFRTGIYRVRSGFETLQTSSPSMDISKASNFERFVFDLVQRDPEMVAGLWRQVAQRGGFDLGRAPYGARLRKAGFVSGRSTHDDRIDTIRTVSERYGIVVDPHTADGIKVALEHRQQGAPLVCIETALPAKFAATVREALGVEPPRPLPYEGLEALPQRFVTLPADATAVRSYLSEHART
jgi:threonine synthase